MSKKEKREKIVQQRWCGIAFIVISAIIFYLASQGTNIYDTDATGCVLTLPLGVWMLCTKQVVIY